MLIRYNFFLEKLFYNMILFLIIEIKIAVMVFFIERMGRWKKIIL